METNRTGAVSAATAPTSPEVSIPEVLGNHVCFLLGTVSTRAIELFGQELTGSKLSVRAAGMLLLLDAQGPTSQNVIGQQMRLERSTMSLAADEVELGEAGEFGCRFGKAFAKSAGDIEPVHC